MQMTWIGVNGIKEEMAKNRGKKTKKKKNDLSKIISSSTWSPSLKSLI